jgi:ribose 5-phosphate isomerase B
LDLSKKVTENENNKAIFVCSAGILENILLNKIKGIRAAIITNHWLANMCRAHNRLNVFIVSLDVNGKHLALANL